MQSGHVNAASFIELGIGWLTISGISRTLGGIHDEAIYCYILIMLLSDYLLGRRAAFGFTLASIGAIWWLATLEHSGTFTPALLNNPLKAATYLTIIFVFIFLIIYVVSKALTDALENAQKELTERLRIETELERLATTDPLTGAYNRREFARLAQVELERARRYGHPTSAILLDVDHFKKVNDTYGHAAGDDVLVVLAQLLTREVRASDLVARYGGEEFMLFLPETSQEKAWDIAERIRRVVADMPVMVDDQIVRFTVSMGVTSSENVGQDFESLLREADRLLYQAKQSGRNQVVSHR